ncbi:MAG TPA: response regulator transcription factor [Stellaceae bacterium]|nr:response regulator transcription factor [Stellaceae bacterium]
MTAARRVLIVDDDAALRCSLVEQLERDGEFACCDCDTGSRALELAAALHFDAFLLAAALADGNGWELARRMRSVAGAAPIILLTELGADLPRPPLAGSADDQIAKPLRIGELVARLRAHLGRAAARIGPYAFDPDAKLLIAESTGREVRLTEKETAILDYLYRAGDRVTGRETLLGEVWGYQAGIATHTLETHIYRLRQKIERDPGRAEILVTAPGGYRLAP